MSAEERGWWDALKGDDILHNTAGNPPYDVDAVCDFLEVVLDTGNVGTVLDVGCGVGRLTKRCAERWPHSFVVGVDTAPSLIALAEVDAPSNAGFLPLGDGTCLDGYSNQGRMDAVYSVTVFQHIPHDVAAHYCSDVYEMLASGRRFAFTWVEGTEDTFLSHQADRATVDGWLHAAGFTKIVHLTCPDHPLGWRWAVATKGTQ